MAEPLAARIRRHVHDADVARMSADPMAKPYEVLVITREQHRELLDEADRLEMVGRLQFRGWRLVVNPHYLLDTDLDCREV